MAPSSLLMTLLVDKAVVSWFLVGDLPFGLSLNISLGAFTVDISPSYIVVGACPCPPNLFG